MSVTDVRQLGRAQSISFDQFAGEGGKCCKRSDCKDNSKLKYQVDRGYDPIKAEPAIQQLRKAVEDCQLQDSSDEFLVKWLIVQDFDVDRAEKLLRQSLEWRRVSGADDILDSYTPSEVLKQYFSMSYIGNDKFSCPIFVCCLGRMDIKGLLLSVTKKEYYNYLTWMFETFAMTIQEENKRTGCQTRKQTLVFDMDQFSMKLLTSKPAGAVMAGGSAIVMMIKHYLSYYPDSFRRIFVINAPSIFPWVFGFIKPMFAQSDFPKIKIFNSSKKEWMAALLDEIDEDQLPTYYGGNMTDATNGDPKCPIKLNMGGQVPHSYYLRKNPPIAKDYMEMLNISAGVGGKKKLKFEVDVPYSAIRWEFMSDGGDIAFRIYSKKNSCEIVPMNRVDSHILMEEGQVTCDEPGQYVFQFDNSYSYLRKKRVHYHIVVDLPDNSQ